MTQPDDAASLRIPLVDPEWSNLELALALAGAGFYVLPTRDDGDAKHAGSVLGKGWPAKSSRDPEVIVSWFAGTDHRVAIHCGRSGLVVFDLDHPEKVPDKLGKAIANEAPPFQATRPEEPGRGHALFRQPAGRRIGNRAGKLGKEFGEVRGTNGIILVGGPGREWLQTGDVPELPTYVAELLPDVEDGEAAVSDAELLRFMAAHTLGVRPEKLSGILTGFAQLVDAGGSRHDAAVSCACWAVREVIAGLIPARKAFRELGDAFVTAMAEVRTPTDRVLERARAEAEFASAVAWAIGQIDSAPAGIDVEEGDTPVEDLAERARAAAREAQIEAEVERLEIRAEAARRLTLQANKDRPRIADGLVFDFDAIQPPTMLLDSLIPEDAIGIVGGKSGAYKSFLAVAWGCSIAAGRPWLDRTEFKVRRALKVLYVAAEGPAGVAARIRAWQAVTGISVRDKLVLYPRPISLTDPAQVEELIEVVAEHGFEFLIIDTLHRSMPGVEENSSTEFGAVFEAVAPLRDQHECGLLFVDHTGHAGERLRGTSSKGDDADYVLLASYDGVDRSAGVQRELRVFKLKDWDSSDRWPIRLDEVEGQAVPIVTIGAIGDAEPVTADHGWFAVPRALIPDVVRANEGKAGDAACDIWRVLFNNGGMRGLTKAEIQKTLKQAADAFADYVAPTEGSFNRGMALLAEQGAIDKGETDSRFLALAPVVRQVPPNDLQKGV